MLLVLLTVVLLDMLLILPLLEWLELVVLLLLGGVCSPGYMGYAAMGGSTVLSGGSCGGCERTDVDGDGAVDGRLGITLPRGVYSTADWVLRDC